MRSKGNHALYAAIPLSRAIAFRRPKALDHPTRSIMPRMKIRSRNKMTASAKYMYATVRKMVRPDRVNDFTENKFEQSSTVAATRYLTDQKSSRKVSVHRPLA